jgi:polysaccharide biosynthesis protein VpsQ
MKRLGVGFLFFVVVIIILADNGKMPHLISALYDFPYGDKVGHFFLFGLLNFFLALAFLPSFPNQPRIRVLVSIGLILALAIAIEEWSQHFFSTRTADWLDLLASYLGLTVGGLAAWRLIKQ